MTEEEASPTALANAHGPEPGSRADRTPGAASRSFSVVICAYTEDRWADLSAAIQSVRDQSLRALEIIVVADHNATLEARVRSEMPDVNVVPNREQQGLSGARNSGVAIARGDVIAFLDDDAFAASDWLEQLSAAYDIGPHVLGAGGWIEPVWANGRPSWFPEELDWVIGCTYRGMPRERAVVRNMIGANMSFQRRIFDTIGGFRSEIGRVGTRPVGAEETEVCIRVRRQWPESVLLYEPAARVFHRVPASRGSWRYYRARCRAEGISKARVSAMVGSDAALSTERRYVLRTLPAGVLRGIRDAVLGRDPSGLARAGAIVAGLAITTAGYVEGTVSSRLSKRGG